MLPELVFPLPTLDHLQVSKALVDHARPEAASIVSEWFAKFSLALESQDISAFSSLLLPNGEVYWRDILAFTWTFRTFAGSENITHFLTDQLSKVQPTGFELEHEDRLAFQQPWPDTTWIQFFFKFRTGSTGLGSGVIRLVPIPRGDSGIEWKAHSIFTNLEGFVGHPERAGALRNTESYRGKWRDERSKETAYLNRDPTVLIVGGGQAGLEVAARLKTLGIDSLVMEKAERIGGNWRARYEALCLHDPVWYDHMPYLPFPPTWPVYCPALKMANWLEFYAEALDLNIWLSSEVTKLQKDDKPGFWQVTVVNTRKSALPETRMFTVKHVVFATGFGAGESNFPSYPGMDNFEGSILHSLHHKRALDHQGKKVVVIGACTSAHDIAADFYEHGIDVTMYQRSSTYVMSTKNGFGVMMKGLYEENGPPTDLADRINASFPNLLMVPVGQRQVQEIADLDKDTLDGLQRRGFKINWGHMGAGCLMSAWVKAGGYYLDVGASQLIIDGKIKFKGDGQIKEFTTRGILFDNGTTLDADVVVFATGLGDSAAVLKKVLDPALVPQVSPIWGLNDEGEWNGVWREVGLKGVWHMQGNLALTRFYSKHIALQIKAIEEGIFGERYE